MSFVFTLVSNSGFLGFSPVLGRVQPPISDLLPVWTSHSLYYFYLSSSFVAVTITTATRGRPLQQEP